MATIEPIIKTWFPNHIFIEKDWLPIGNSYIAYNSVYLRPSSTFLAIDAIPPPVISPFDICNTAIMLANLKFKGKTGQTALFADRLGEEKSIQIHSDCRYAFNPHTCYVLELDVFTTTIRNIVVDSSNGVVVRPPSWVSHLPK